jgi:hypothetical protein
VHAIADTGLKLNNLSHKTIEKLLKQQVAMLDDMIDGGAQQARDRRARQDRQDADRWPGRGAAEDPRSCREERQEDRRAGAKPATPSATSSRTWWLTSPPPARPAEEGCRSPGRAKKPAAKKAAAKKRAARKAPAKKAAAKKAQAA